MPTQDLTPAKQEKAFAIAFEDDAYLLSIENLQKLPITSQRKGERWQSTLKFISFKDGRLELLNSSNQVSYKLGLQVEGKQLLVSCSCGADHLMLCAHARSGLFMILWKLGEHYFAKLQPNGIIPLAFKHKKYFDRKENEAGINASPRSELESVFKLNQRLSGLDLPALLQLHTPVTQNNPDSQDEAAGYLFVRPFGNRFLPFLIPIAGRLNKGRTGLKTCYGFLSGADQQHAHLLTPAQKELNAASYQLWKDVEKLPGSLLKELDSGQSIETLLKVFEAWQQLLPTLSGQPFVYSYYLYRTEALRKGRPAKGRMIPVKITALSPELQFRLVDMGAFCRLELQVLVKGKLLTGYTADTPFFITDATSAYLLASLRDAAIAQWMHCSGGTITVFKEHFAAFEAGIFNPLKTCYPVKSMTKPTTKSLHP